MRVPSNPAGSLYAGTLQTLGLSKLKGRRWAHVTPRYVMNRLGVHVYQRRHPDHPWLTRQMVAILDEWLQPSDIGHEWGSGRSTAWFARKISHLTSVEHHPAWGMTVRDLLAAEQIAEKVEYHVISDSNSKSQQAYIDTVKRHADRSLDFCLVDGILRDHCALAVLPKIKPGGLLIIDNVNWFLPRKSPSHSPNSRTIEQGSANPVWHEVQQQISSWRCIWTTDGVTDTAFWINPR